MQFLVKGRWLLVFYTLTANPAVDMTVMCSPLIPNENVRSHSAGYTANGKGLDVSFALKKFGVDSVALGFFAGFTGKYVVEETMNTGCLCRPVWIDGVTRINSYFNDGENEYGILNPGPVLTPQGEQELYNILDTTGDLECLVVSGSLPRKASKDFLDKVVELRRRVAPTWCSTSRATSSRRSAPSIRCSSSRTTTRCARSSVCRSTRTTTPAAPSPKPSWGMTLPASTAARSSASTARFTAPPCSSPSACSERRTTHLYI